MPLFLFLFSLWFNFYNRSLDNPCFYILMLTFYIHKCIILFVAMSGFSAEAYSSIAQWQSIRLLTEGLLVRAQLGERIYKKL